MVFIIIPHPAPHPADGTDVFPDLPCHAADDAEFAALVKTGLASLEAGPNLTLEDVEKELRSLLHSKA